jgi:phosphoribosylamine-glycine ligase
MKVLVIGNGEREHALCWKPARIAADVANFYTRNLMIFQQK